MSKNLQSAGCFVIRDTNGETELLLMFREWPTGEKGWILPKGGVEEGETLEECALRETAEETGYTDLEIIKKLDVEIYFHPERKIRKNVQWFLAKANSNNHKDPEHTKMESNSYIEIHWKKMDEALSLLTFDHNKKTLRKIIDMSEKTKIK